MFDGSLTCVGCVQLDQERPAFLCGCKRAGVRAWVCECRGCVSVVRVSVSCVCRCLACLLSHRKPDYVRELCVLTSQW